MLKFMNEVVKVSTVTGLHIEGKVYDQTEDNRYIHVETEDDYFVIDTKTADVEIIEQIAIAEDREVKSLKDAKAELKKLIKWADETKIAVQIYNFDEQGETGFDVEIKLEHDEEVEYITLNTFGHEKPAMKRARAILRSVKDMAGEYVKDILVYHC